MIGCSVLGVAVDDTIHSLVSYRRLRDGGATPEHAVLVTMREVGRPMVISSLMLIAGLPHHHRLGLRHHPRVRLAVGAHHGDLPGRRSGDAAGAPGPGSRVIELVVFDLDGVLADLDRPRRLELLAEMTGRTPAFLQAKIWDSDFETGAERGSFATGDEYLAEWNWRTKCQLTRAQWVRARREAMTLRPETLRIAEAAQSHCGIAMLTNNGPLLYESLSEILPDVFRIFGSRAHASFQFGAAKPQPRGVLAPGAPLRRGPRARRGRR